MTKKKKYRKNNHIWYPCRFTIREPYSNHKYLNHKHKKKKKVLNSSRAILYNTTCKTRYTIPGNNFVAYNHQSKIIFIHQRMKTKSNSKENKKKITRKTQ